MSLNSPRIRITHGGCISWFAPPRKTCRMREPAMAYQRSSYKREFKEGGRKSFDRGPKCHNLPIPKDTAALCRFSINGAPSTARTDGSVRYTRTAQDTLAFFDNLGVGMHEVQSRNLSFSIPIYLACTTTNSALFNFYNRRQRGVLPSQQYLCY